MQSLGQSPRVTYLAGAWSAWPTRVLIPTWNREQVRTNTAIKIWWMNDECFIIEVWFWIGGLDEDIPNVDTTTTHPHVQGPLIRARSRQLNYHLLSFLGTIPNIHENMIDEVQPRQCPCLRAFKSWSACGIRRTRRRSDNTGRHRFYPGSAPLLGNDLCPACLTLLMGWLQWWCYNDGVDWI
jgi:hypothetical protein